MTPIASWLVLCVAVAAPLSAAAGLAAPAACIRNATAGLLPSSVVPAHYFLGFSLPDPDDVAINDRGLVYTGRVVITASVAAPTSCVVLNAGAGLNITAVSVNGVVLPSKARAKIALSNHESVLRGATQSISALSMQ